jgi:hypothetical protein
MDELSAEVKKAADSGQCTESGIREVKMPKYVTWNNYEQWLAGNVERYCVFWRDTKERTLLPNGCGPRRLARRAVFLTASARQNPHRLEDRSPKTSQIGAEPSRPRSVLLVSLPAYFAA